MELTLQDSGKQFPGGTVALKNINLSVFQGEFVSVIGPSGAGKTTLFRILNGMDILTSGGPARSTEVFVYLIYRYAMVDFRMDRAATAAVMFFLILLVITVLTMKVSDRSVTYDS